MLWSSYKKKKKWCYGQSWCGMGYTCYGQGICWGKKGWTNEQDTSDSALTCVKPNEEIKITTYVELVMGSRKIYISERDR